MSVKVYRFTENWKGARPKDLEDSYLGEIDGVIRGGATPQGIGRFPGVVSTEGQLGVPYKQKSGILLQQNDLLRMGDDVFEVKGPRQWEEPEIFSGTGVVDDYYWVEVNASHGL